MNGQSKMRHTLSRQRPLALCLACAVGAGIMTVAPATHSAVIAPVDGLASPRLPRIRGPRISVPGDLPAGSPLRAAWEQRLSDPLSARPAATIPVTNCDDSGPGSLRDAVTNAVDGDTIDMTSLTCSTITLTTGSLGTFVNDVTLNGPGSHDLAISGNYASSVLEHVGYGTLSIDGVTIENGYKYGSSPRGGCIFSEGTVHLSDVALQGCYALHAPYASPYPALGGAVYAAEGLSLSDSVVTNSKAYSLDTDARGGGLFSGFNVTLYQSIVSSNTTGSGGVGSYTLGGGIYALVGVSLSGGSVEGNAARAYYASTTAKGGGIYAASDLTSVFGNVSGNSVASVGTHAYGGGIYALNGITIGYSTIADNYSSSIAGGLVVQGSPSIGMLTIGNSTISGNVASGAAGGVFCTLPASVNNSTIAFNTENSNSGSAFVAAGLTVVNQPLTLQSSIIAQNYNNEYPAYRYSDLSGAVSVSGANNLVRRSYGTPLPVDTITGTDPLLLPLADNGGPTRTHALSPFSPALDVGNDNSGYANDQRGDGYPRVVGANADIGAFEGTSPDDIFGDGFDP